LAAGIAASYLRSRRQELSREEEKRERERERDGTGGATHEGLR
jgi:hypothetical protein